MAFAEIPLTSVVTLVNANTPYKIASTINPAVAKRKSVYIRNTTPSSVGACTVFVTQAQQTNTSSLGGYPLYNTGAGIPGEFVVFSNGTNYDVFQGEFYVWSSTANAQVNVIEEMV